MNRLIDFFIVAVLCAMIGSSVRAVDPTPPSKLLRLGIVDDSGSMAGERIETVRMEWLNLARQLPPSPENPIVLVTFGSAASAPKVFVDLPSFEAAIGTLHGGSGGTDIAAGLREGITYLSSIKNTNDVWVMLYTDGEGSGSADDLIQAEAELDAIFAGRQQQGLSQTVFLKRWGNANADLLARIQARGHARVLDAEDLTVNPITFDPQVDLVGVTWNAVNPLLLDVEYILRLDVRGDVAGLVLPKLALTVDVAGATGDLQAEVQAGDSPLPRKVTIPITPEERALGKVIVPLLLTPPANIPSDNALVLPILASTQIDLPVDLPVEHFDYQIVVTQTSQPGVWSDPLVKRIRTPLQLKFEVKSRDGETVSPGDIELVPATGTVIVGGSTTVVLPASGTVTVDIEIETLVANLTEPPAQWRSSFELTTNAVRVRPQTTITPPQLTIQGELSIPPALTTPIEAQVTRVLAAEWVNLAQGTARFQVETEFDVQGPIAPNSKITLVTTGSIVSVALNPTTLQTGSQRVTLDVTATVPPSPKTQAFEFQIVPPTSDGVIQYQASQSLQFVVMGPKAVSLGVASRGRAVRELRTSMDDNDSLVQLQLEPIVVGMKPTAVASGLDVKLDAPNEPLKFSNPGSYRVFSRCQLTVPVSVPKSLSFFQDSILAGTLDIEPLHPNPAVQGGSVPLVVIVAAPFKRLLWQLALALSAILAAVVIVRMYLTLRRTD